MQRRHSGQVLEVLEQRAGVDSVQREVLDAAAGDLGKGEVDWNVGREAGKADVRQTGDFEDNQPIGLLDVQLAVDQIDAGRYVGAAEVDDAARDAHITLATRLDIRLPSSQRGERAGVACHDIAVVEFLSREPGKLLTHPDVMACVRVADVVQQGRRLVRAEWAGRETHGRPFETPQCREWRKSEPASSSHRRCAALL